MESGDATLEQSLVWFEEGMDLIRSCQAQLNNAEQKVQELIQNTDGKIDIKDTKRPLQNHLVFGVILIKNLFGKHCLRLLLGQKIIT